MTVLEYLEYGATVVPSWAIAMDTAYDDNVGKLRLDAIR